MATETKKVSKLDEVLNKIDAFFTNLMSAKKDDTEEPEEDDDMSAAAAPAPAAPSTKKATDEEDSQDPDNDDDPDKDDDDDLDMKKANAEIASLKAELSKKDATIAAQNGLLKEAKTSLEQKDEAIRETIVSTFKPTSSQRSTKKAVEGELPSFAIASTDLGKRAASLAAKRSK